MGCANGSQDCQGKVKGGCFGIQKKKRRKNAHLHSAYPYAVSVAWGGVVYVYSCSATFCHFTVPASPAIISDLDLS